MSKITTPYDYSKSQDDLKFSYDEFCILERYINNALINKFNENLIENKTLDTLCDNTFIVDIIMDDEIDNIITKFKLPYNSDLINNFIKDKMLNNGWYIRETLGQCIINVHDVYGKNTLKVGMIFKEWRPTEWQLFGMWIKKIPSFLKGLLNLK